MIIEFDQVHHSASSVRTLRIFRGKGATQEDYTFIKVMRSRHLQVKGAWEWETSVTVTDVSIGEVVFHEVTTSLLEPML